MFKQLLHYIHPSWIFYAVVWGVISGLVIGVAFQLSIFLHVSILIFSILIILFCLRFSRPFTVTIAFLAGFILGNFRISQDLTSQSILKSYENQTVIIVGALAEDPDDSGGTTAIRIQNFCIFRSESEITEDCPSIPGLLYITLSGTNNLERSDFITLQGKLGTGFGNFIGKMTRPKVISITRSNPGDIFAKFKHWFADLVRDFIPSPEVDLGLGYLMGMKSGLSTDFSEALRAVGMTHVVVASGAHLAILTSAAKKIFGKISKFASLFFSLILISAFVMIVGFTPSMTRAALVAGLSVLVGYVGRSFTPFRLISFVAMVTLLINPSHFLNLGWQLSFASFFAILILAPRLTKTFYGGKAPPWLASMLLTSLATSLVCAPILIFNFGTLSLLSFIANLIILPTLPYAMLGMMLTGALSFLPLLPVVIAKVTTLLLDLHIWLVNFLSNKTAFILELPSADSRIFLLYLPLLAYLISPAIIKIIKIIRTPSKTPAASPLASTELLCYNHHMIIKDEPEMLQLGHTLARVISLPAVFELIGDVGAGKTTFTRGLAEGLGIAEPITSPSFTISKRYAFNSPTGQPAELIHYDFYRLSDPGIMRDELSETLNQPNSVVVVEWGGDVSDLLPSNKYQLKIHLNPDGTRTVDVNDSTQSLLSSSDSNTTNLTSPLEQQGGSTQ